ncbi:MAG: branched-chain amino acid ABC transporter permease [Janthinobacterium lividum]
MLPLISFNVLVSIATLIMISIGLGVIFGMMKVINLAHGEFMMLGAYAAVLAAQHGVNLWIAILVVAPLCVGVLGLVVERLIIRWLYGRIVDTMLATWGLSLALSGLASMVFGNDPRAIDTPLGSFSLGGYEASLYGVVIIVAAVASLLGWYALLRLTRLGLVMRATMQNGRMAAALGVAPPKIYMLTFAFGAAMAGLAGGLLAPLSGVSPMLGAAYVAKAFITVVGGGPAFIAGTGLAATGFGIINELTSFFYTPVIGDLALLVAAILAIRLMPNGITGRFFKGGL